MASKNYFELATMLRMQLPVLLSFAFMRCLMGYSLSFWLSRVLPSRMKDVYKVASVAFDNITLALNVIMLSAAGVFSTRFYDTWQKNAEQERPRIDLVCSEFACTRAQGLVCAIALFTMFAKRDPLTLALALATLKAVTDGTVFILVMGGYVLAACRNDHYNFPKRFFLIVYVSSLVYSFNCYSDEDSETRGRIGGSVLSLCFSTLFLGYKMFEYSVHALKSKLMVMLNFALRQFQRLRAKID
jgi:hypothetical protein